MIIILLLIIMAITNPSKSDFDLYISKAINSSIESTQSTNGIDSDGLLIKAINGLMTSAATITISKLTERRDYTFFSIYTINTSALSAFFEVKENPKFLGVFGTFIRIDESLNEENDISQNSDKSSTKDSLFSYVSGVSREDSIAYTDNYSVYMDLLAKKAKIKYSDGCYQFNKYETNFVYDIIHKDYKDAIEMVDDGSISKKHAEATLKAMNVNLIIPNKRSAKGIRFEQTANKLMNAGLCIANSYNWADVYANNPDSDSSKIVLKALSGDQDAINFMENARFHP